MINKEWFKENNSFCTYDEYERGKERYIKACIKKQRQEDIKNLPLFIKIYFLGVVFVALGTIYCMVTGKMGNSKDDNYITRTASTRIIMR